MGVSYNSWVTPGHIYRDEGGTFSGNLSGQAGFDYFRDSCQADDALYFGHNPRFDDIRVYVGTAFVAAAVTFVWEYWNGSAWAELPVTDGTNGWQNLGRQIVSFVPPDDWREHPVNGVTRMWVRCRVSAVTNPTEGGANAMEAAQVGDNLLVVTGYSEAVPCTLEDLYQASLNGSWSVVLKQGADQYFLRARLQVGDGSTPTWFADERKQVELAHLGVSWSNVTSLYTLTNATARFGRVLDEARKIGGHGCAFNWGTLSDNNIRTFGGALEFYGCTFSSRGGNARIVHSANVKIWNCQFHGWQVGTFNLSASELHHVLLLDSAAIDETQPSTVMDDLTSVLSGGNAFMTYYGGVTIRNWKVIGTPAYLLFVFYHGSPVTLIDCESPVWRISWNQYRQPVYRRYTLSLRVSDREDVPVSGARVEIQDAFGDPVPESPFLTDEAGQIPPQRLDYAVYSYESGLPDDTRATVFSPYTVRISKAGYADYVDTVEVNRPHLDLEVALQPTPGPAGTLEVEISRPELLEVALNSPQIEVELFDREQ